MKRLVTIIALLAFALAATTAHASQSTTLHLKAGAPKSMLFGHFGQYDSVLLWVYVNGRNIPATSSTGANLTMYYAGWGTLVQITATRHAGPMRVKAVTWYPHPKVRIVYRVMT